MSVRVVWIAVLCSACGGSAPSAPPPAHAEAEAPLPSPAPEEDVVEVEDEVPLEPVGTCEDDPAPLELGDRDVRVEATRAEGRSILRIASWFEDEVRGARCERALRAGEPSSAPETESHTGRLDGERVVVVLERAQASETEHLAVAWVLDAELRSIGQVASEGASETRIYGDVLVLGERAYAVRNYELFDVGAPPPPPPARELALERLSHIEREELSADQVHELHPTSCDAESIEGIYVYLDGEEAVIAQLLVHVIEGRERWLAWRPGELRGIIDGASIAVDCVQCDGAGPPELVVRQRDYRGPVDRWNDLPQADLEHVEIVRLEDDAARTLVTWRTGAQPIAEAPYFAHRARVELGGAAPLRVVRERARGARAREGRALVAEGSYACGPTGVVRAE